MRILMLGTGPFAVPTFESLLNSSHHVPALITRPEVAAKGRKEIVNPMRAFAETRQVPVYAPTDINAAEGVELLRSFQADLLVVCDYGQILSNEALGSAKVGGINLHGSLLPKYRGAAPLNWAIWKGEQETGVTVIHMTPLLDGGPAIAIRSTPIGPNETTAELEPRLAQLGVPAVLEAIEKLEKWDGHSPLGERQDQALATKARRLRKSDGNLQWQRSATEILNQVRALKPWPGTFTFLLRQDGEPLRLVVDAISVANSTDGDAIAGGGTTGVIPGEVVAVSKDRLQVAAGAGVISLERLQPAGKKTMSIADFLRGYPVRVGDRFGPLPGDDE